MKKKNSLIELLRFVFAVNVVKNHGFFPYQGELFGPATISVEFFFVLSGYLFVSTLDKVKDKPLLKGVCSLYKNKILGLGIPLFVGLLFNVFYKVVAYQNDRFGFLGYLWYVHDMLIVFACFYILRYVTTNEQTFWAIVAIVTVVASVLHATDALYLTGLIRAFAAIPAGMLVRKIPKLQSSRPWVAYVGFIVVWACVMRMLFMPFSPMEEEVLNILLYPSLIYFAFHINLSVPVFDYLGSLSFGLYAYQSIPRWLREIGYTDTWLHLAIIVACAVTTDGVMRIIKARRHKKAAETETLAQAATE